MSEQGPTVGQVINHFYLWRHEAADGHQEGRKPRHCAIVRVDTQDKEGLRVFVAPISHVSPDVNKGQRGIEIPEGLKRRLGLDDARSWLYTSELNHFLWPGFDLKKTADGRDHYGLLPGNLIRALRAEIAANYKDQTLKLVNRDEKPRSRSRAIQRKPQWWMVASAFIFVDSAL